MERVLPEDWLFQERDWSRYTEEEVFLARWLYYEYQCSKMAIRQVLKLGYLSELEFDKALKGTRPEYAAIKDGIDDDLKKARHKGGRHSYGIETTKSAYAEIIKGTSLES